MSELNPFDREAMRALAEMTERMTRDSEIALARARGELAASAPPVTAPPLAPVRAVVVALALLVLAVALTGLHGTASGGVVTPPQPVPSPSPGVPVPAPGEVL
jgi:hypothetical protein